MRRHRVNGVEAQNSLFFVVAVDDGTDWEFSQAQSVPGFDAWIEVETGELRWTLFGELPPHWVSREGPADVAPGGA